MSKKILVVEDEISLRNAQSAKFKSEGFEVMEAPDGPTALAMAKKNKPDIILLDIIMPKQNGLDVLREFKSNTSLASVPIFTLTNLSDEGTMSEAKKLGAEEYLVKSNTTLEEIVDKINKRLNQ